MLNGDAWPRALARLVRFSVNHAKALLVFAAALSAILLYFTATHLALDTNTENMLDERLRFRTLIEKYDRAFPQLIDQIVVVIDADTPGHARQAAQRLAAELEPERAFQSVYLPTQPEFFDRHGLLYLDEAKLWELNERLTEAAPFLGALAQDPSLRGLFTVLGRAFDQELSADYRAQIRVMLDSIRQAIETRLTGRPYQRSWRELLAGDQREGEATRSFVVVQPNFDNASFRQAGAALDRVREISKTMEAGNPHELRIRLTGSVAIEDEELASVTAEAGIATLASFVLVCGLLFFGLRSKRLVLAILFTLFVGLIWTASFAAFAIGSLNLISVTFAVLFIGLAVDFGIQFGMRYREETQTENDNSVALSRATLGVAGALTLAALAAAISFFSFVPTSYRGLAELGVIAGAGMFIAFFANLTVLPALLTVMAARADAPMATRAASFLPARYRKTILWTAAILAVGSAALLPCARFDFNPLNLKDDRTESVAVFRDLLADPATSPYSIQVVAADLAEAQQTAARLSRLPQVDKALTVASFIPDHQQEKLDIIADMALVLQPLVNPGKPQAAPSAAEEVAAIEAFKRDLLDEHAAASDPAYAESIGQLIAALERLQARGTDEPALQDLRRRILGDLPATLEQLRRLLTPSEVTLTNLPPALKARYLNPEGQARVEVFPKQNVNDNRALRDFVTAVQAVEPDAVGAPVTLVAAADAVIASCIEAAIYALIGALILLLIVLRSLKDALLVLLPLALAALLTVASSVLFNVPFNFANLIALPLLLGIGIAFGIYLVMRSREGLAIDDLFRSSTPRAVFFSAATTIVSFGALAFSAHRGMSSMGILLTLALSYALISTLVVLPALLRTRN